MPGAHLQLHLSYLCFLTHDVQQCVHLQASYIQGPSPEVIMLRHKDWQTSCTVGRHPDIILPHTCWVLRPLPSSSS